MKTSDLRTRVIPGRPWTFFMLLVVVLLPIPVLTACGSSGDAASKAKTDARVVLSSGSYATTANDGEAVELPEPGHIVVQAIFDEPIYGSAGQTSVFATAEPSSYQIQRHTASDPNTYTFSIQAQASADIQGSIFASRDAEPLVFTLLLD